jgi:RNA polymerase primary sigma factor
VSDLPKLGAVGEAAIRLRREEQLAQSGDLLQNLEETDPLRLYLEELAQMPACGDMELLSRRLLEGDKSVTQSITNLMLSRVVSNACEMTGRGVLLLDLIQEGSLGLWQAILNYEGGDLEALCERRIRWDLARAVTMQARSSGVGQKLRSAMEDYRAVDERLLSELGRNPTLEEIAEAMHMSVEETAAVAKNLEAARLLAQAKQPVQPEQEEAEERQAVEDTAYFQMRQRIADLLSELNEQEKTLLTLRFGLEGGKPLTAEQVGARLGMTPEEAVRMEAAVLSKLRHE